MSAHSPILIVDDDWFFCRLVSETLETAGYSVRVVRNARDAMLVLGRERLSLGIIDYRLGKTDGVSLIEQIRESGAKLPIIFLSGFSYDERIFNHLRNVLQVSVLMRKPIKPASFISTVEQVLQGRAFPESFGFGETTFENGFDSTSAFASDAHEDPEIKHEHFYKRQIQQLRTTQSHAPKASELAATVQDFLEEPLPSRQTTRLQSGARRSGGHQRFLWNEPIFCSGFYITGDSTVSEMEKLAEFYEENLKQGLQLLDEDTYGRLCAWILFKSEQESNITEKALIGKADFSSLLPEQAAPGTSSVTTTSTENSNQMEVPASQQIEELIHQLHLEYGAALPQELMTMYRKLRKALTSKSDDDLDEAIFTAHRVKGTCGSYGFKDVATVIEFFEEVLRQPGERNSGWSESCLSLARTAMRLIRQDTKFDQTASDSSIHLLYVGNDDSLVKTLEQAGSGLVTNVVTQARTIESTLTLIAASPWAGVLIDTECIGIRNALNLVAFSRNIPEMQTVGFALLAAREDLIDEAQLLYSGISSAIVKPATHSKLTKALESIKGDHDPRGRVLLIDSDTSLMARLTLALRRFGLGTRVASSHLEVMESMDEFQPHAIIAGELLPNLSGRELGLLLKVPERWKSIDVFVLVDPHVDAVQYAEAALACDWFPRGGSLKDLAERIFDHLESSTPFAAQRRTSQTRVASIVERLDEMMQEATDLEQPIAIAVIAPIELNGFEFSTGQVGSLVEGLLSTRFRPVDFRAKLDPTKFVLACPGKTAFAIQEALKMFIREIEAVTISNHAGNGVKVLYSVSESPASGSNPEVLIDKCIRQIQESQAIESSK